MELQRLAVLFIFLCVPTALHAASLSGHVSTVKLLLEKEAMVDSLDVMKHTPLFRACEMGHRDVILTLIQGWRRGPWSTELVKAEI